LQRLTLAMPYREYLFQMQVTEVYEPLERPRVGKNEREIFIFNDVVVVCG
jgi:hypothetical protein